MKKRIIALVLCIFTIAALDVAMAETAGVREVDGKHYYFDAEGQMMTVPEAGLYSIDDVTYYFYADSSIKTVTSNGYKKIDGIYYYMKKPYYIDDTKARKIISNNMRYYYDIGGNLLTSADAKRSTWKHNGKTFELRTAAKQYVGGYDTMQGGCTDETYAYFAMNNRNVEKCRIAKVRLSDNKVVKTSGILNIAHGNGLTYNDTDEFIVAAHCKVNPNRLSIIDPTTLKVKKNIDVKIPSTLKGATKSQAEKINGFTDLAYDKYNNTYVGLIRNTHNLLILDENFNPIEHIKLNVKIDGLYQGIDITEDYIIVALSPQGRLTSNVLAVYERNGRYRFLIKVRDGYELENVFHIGNKLYTGFYRSSYDNRRNYVYKLSNYVWEF